MIFWFIFGLLQPILSNHLKENVKLHPFEIPYFINSSNLDRVYKFSTEYDARTSIQCFFKSNKKCESFVKVEGKEMAKWCGKRKLVHVTESGEVEVSMHVDGEELDRCIVQAVTGPHPDQFDNLEAIKFEPEIGTDPGNRSTTCDCGRRYIPAVIRKLMKNAAKNGRIFEGKMAGRGEFTWMVSIRGSELFARCGGSLITAHHVLSAGHCVATVKLGQPYVIQETFLTIGKMRREITKEDLKNVKIIEIKKHNIHVHKRFLEARDMNHDISVMFMEEPVQFGPRVGPVCMTKTFPADLMYHEVLASGWGLDENQNIPDKLKFTHLYTIPTPVCNLRYRNMICIYQKETGTCRGDSGGPIMHYDKETNRYFQISLVSHGFTMECLPGFTATTNLTQNYDWIENIVKKTKPSQQLCTKI